MQTEPSRQIRREITEHRHRRAWRRAVGALMVLAVFCTTYALILPAVTLSTDTTCGLAEHTHSDDCYESQLACGYEEASEAEQHTHTEDCYEKVLTCTRTEHVHDDSCYAADGETTASPAEQDEADVCACGTPCAEGAANEACPVCSGDYALCAAGDASLAAALTVEEVQRLIDELPTVAELEAMPTDEALAWYERLQSIADALDLLSEEERAQLTGTDRLTELAEWFNAKLMPASEVTLGGLTLSGDGLVEGVDYSYDNTNADDDVVTILSSKTITVRNTDGTDTATATRIVIPADVTANLTLAGVNISSDVNSPITLTPGKGTDISYYGSLDPSNANYTPNAAYYNDGGATCHITLADGSKNYLTSNHQRYAALRAGESTTLTIDDETEGGDSGNPGSLEATGYKFGAGIGGAACESGGNITIDGGVITSTVKDGDTDYGYAAGIGGGAVGDGGNITINGGIITAKGSYHGAGIGGGCYNPKLYESEMGFDKDLSPAVINKVTCTYNPSNAWANSYGERGYSGNITINGGYIKSYAVTRKIDGEDKSHGCAFGDGCIGGSGTTKNKGFVVKVTGGTVLAYSQDKKLGDLSFSGGGSYYSYDLGCLGGNVIVTGGSLLANTFLTVGEVEKAYDDYGINDENEVFMTYISMKYLNLGERGLKVTGLTMKVDGNEVVYASGKNFGLPSYTDDQDMFYLWIPATQAGKEVSVELELWNTKTNQKVDTATFYVKPVKRFSYLKQYVDFSSDLTSGINSNESLKNSLKKRYTGTGFSDDVVNSVKNAAKGMTMSNPSNATLSDTSLGIPLIVWTFE